MTFVYFVTCMGISLAPYVLLYRLFSLSEYRAFGKCVHAAGAYGIAFLAKMLILATVTPHGTDDVTTSNDAVSGMHIPKRPEGSAELALAVAIEAVRIGVEVIDVVVIAYILDRVYLRGLQRFLACAIGWGIADVLLLRLSTFWVGARVGEFDWKYLLLAFEANVNCMRYVSIVVGTHMLRRKDLPPAAFKFLAAVTMLLLSIGNLVDFLSMFVAFSHAQIIMLKAVVVLALSLTMWGTYQASAMRYAGSNAAGSVPGTSPAGGRSKMQ